LTTVWPAAGLLVLWAVNRGRLWQGLKSDGSVGFAGQEQIELAMCLFLTLYVFAIVRQLNRPAESVQPSP
jgi:hypothetical protein